MDSVKQGRPEQYGEELIVLHNDAVEHGITVEPMRRIDVAQKDTIVTAILDNMAYKAPAGMWQRCYVPAILLIKQSTRHS